MIILDDNKKFVHKSFIPFVRKILKKIGLFKYLKRIALQRLLVIQNGFYYRKLVPLLKKHPVINTHNDCPCSILHINTYDSFGGAAILSNTLSNHLARNGFESRMLVSKKLSGNDGNIGTIPKSWSLYNKLLNQKALSELGPSKWDDFFKISIFNIKKHKYFQNADLVHLHNLHGGYFSPFFLPELTALKPTIWTIHDMGELFAPCGKDVECKYWEQDCKGCEYFDLTVADSNSYFLWKVKREILSLSRLRKIVCPSEWLKKKVKKTYFKNTDVVRIYNGIDVEIFKKYDKNYARDKLGLPRNKYILMFMALGGINNREKGGHYITSIYERLRADDNIFFLSIGGEKDKSEGNWKEVSYIKDPNKIALYFSAADIFVYPTLLDVFGLVVAESISCGTPVITFKTGGVPELVEHMKTGYIAEHGNINDLIHGVELFINKVDLRKKANHVGHNIIAKRFSLDLMTRNYIKVYEEALSAELNK